MKIINSTPNVLKHSLNSAIDCDACKFKTEQNCKGCKEIKGNVF